jgi:hypothetical protein
LIQRVKAAVFNHIADLTGILARGRRKTCRFTWRTSLRTCRSRLYKVSVLENSWESSWGNPWEIPGKIPRKIPGKFLLPHYSGNRLVEVRHHGVNKSVVLEEVLKTGPRRLKTLNKSVRKESNASESSTTSSSAFDNKPMPSSNDLSDILGGGGDVTVGGTPQRREQTSSATTPLVSPPSPVSQPATPSGLGETTTTRPFEFVLIVGDDRSDEDMYHLLKGYQSRLIESLDEENGEEPPAVFLVHVGTGATGAEYYLENIIELRKILRGMASSSQKAEHARIQL